MLDFCGPDISSSEIRQRVARGESIEDIVPPAVCSYIREHGLYICNRSRDDIRKILANTLKPSRFEHTLGVAETAVRLAERFGVDSHRARLAALLHDCGTAIRYYDHHKNSYYLIINSDITGLSHKETVLSALLARMHRKEISTREIIRHSDILEEKDHDTIIRLSVLLRIAESLDRSMSGLIDGISCDILGDSVIVKTFSKGDLTLEIKDALKSSALFEKAYGKNLIIL
jgi:putative nucleotidyltransferase with HDIG domain